MIKLRDAVGRYRDVDTRLSALESAPTAASAPSAGVREPIANVHLDTGEIARLAEAAARAALEHAHRVRGLDPGRVLRVARRDPPPTTVAGLEREPVAPVLLDDAALIARDGPSIDTLRNMIAGKGCDLQNIEVYYRLGLAHLARGEWGEAMRAFDAVEDASPGYRDAEKRSIEIRRWQSALGENRSVVSRPADTPAGSSGRYVLKGILGRGGMAVVYRATDEVLGREVALKFLTEQMSARADIREMFVREARSVAQLNHPNIVTIYDYGELNGRSFIAMEYVDGITVDQLIREHGQLDPIEALRIVASMLEALDYAHQRKIIHRDIKPSNAMRTSTGIVKLMDFGLARSISESNAASVVAGTPAYMPSEQFLGGDIDHRADIFAVGVSLYEMLSGDLPYRHLDRSKTPPPLSKTASLPAALDAIVLRAVHDDREKRWQSAREMLAPIRQIIDAVARAGS